MLEINHVIIIQPVPHRRKRMRIPVELIWDNLIIPIHGVGKLLEFVNTVHARIRTDNATKPLHLARIVKARMAAAAVAELMGGTNDEVLQAFALAMKNILGLACDPVAGLVEVPCVKRNGVFAVIALTAAEMALAGVRSVIPPDEVIAAMDEIGRLLPVSLKETADGGLAKTETGKAIAERLSAEVEKSK